MKCALCHEKKGKRGCKLTSDQFVCPSCCAATRGAECGGCSYYAPSLEYQREKQLRNRTFVTEIIPEVEDRCDEALALIENGDIAGGEARLEDLRRQYPDHYMVLYGIGTYHCVKDQPDEAIPWLERAVERFPAFAHAHYNLGQCYRRKCDLENAVKAYETAIATDGRDSPVGRLAHERLDELEAMLKENGGSLSLHIRNRRIFDRAFAALREKSFQTAIDGFGQVLVTERKHVQSYGNMGLAYAGLGNRQKALECLDQAIALDPEYEPAIVNRLVIENLKDGEALPGIGGEVNYYSDFKVHGRSIMQHLTDQRSADGTVSAEPAHGKK